MAQINKPNEYFDTLTWTGDNSTRNITDLNFQPDLVWIKHRSFAFDHREFDSVRGASKSLATNKSDAEASPTDELTAFLSNGFTLGNSVTVNGTGYGSNNFVGWNWKAGGTASSNTDGTITSSVSANTTAGFSIVSFTGTGSAGATVGHGLGVTPQVIIIKNRNFADVWVVGHHKLNNGTNPFSYEIYLNLNSAEGAASGSWNNTSPTSSVFTVGSGNVSNKSGDGIVAYCFADVKGFSKFGSYVGNGSADGTFVYTGFKPAWLMVKRSSTSGTDWYMFDNKRNTFNVTNSYLDANTSDAEVSNISFDFTSNGFKLRDSQTIVNGSGSTFIYMAFAENPLVGTNNIPATAR
jgi:hypothetical protein